MQQEKLPRMKAQYKVNYFLIASFLTLGHRQEYKGETKVADCYTFP